MGIELVDVGDTLLRVSAHLKGNLAPEDALANNISRIRVECCSVHLSCRRSHVITI